MKAARTATLVLLVVVLLATIYGSTGSTAAGKPVEMVYWSLWNEGEPQAGVLKGYIAEYTAAHPNVSIKVTWAGRDILTKLQTALSGGVKVDLVDGEGMTLRGGLVVKGLTLPLDKYLQQKAEGENVPFSSIFVHGVLDQLAAPDGSHHLIPYEIITVAFWYDQPIFNKAGVTKPKTWAEFLALCKTLKSKGIPPLTQDAGVDFYNAMWYYHLVERFLGPGALFNAATDKTGAAWDNPAFLKAAQAERELWDDGYFIDGAKGFVWPAGQLELALGHAGMEFLGSWLPNEVKDSTDAGFQWRSFMFPDVPGGKGKQTDVELYPLGWVVLKSAPNPDAAADFIRFSMTKARAQQIADKAVNLSSRRDVTPPPALADAWTDFANATTRFQPYDGLSAAHAEYYKTIFLQIHDQLFLGKITPEAFITQIKAASVNYWKTH